MSKKWRDDVKYREIQQRQSKHPRSLLIFSHLENGTTFLRTITLEGLFGLTLIFSPLKEIFNLNSEVEVILFETVSVLNLVALLAKFHIHASNQKGHTKFCTNPKVVTSRAPCLSCTQGRRVAGAYPSYLRAIAGPTRKDNNHPLSHSHPQTI